MDEDETKDGPKEELRIKKYEELYAVAKKSLEDELSRFERIENKVGRYFTGLAILLGFSAALLGRAAHLLRIGQPWWTLLQPQGFAVPSR